VADPQHDWADIIESIHYTARRAYPDDTIEQDSIYCPKKFTLNDANDIEMCRSPASLMACLRSVPIVGRPMLLKSTCSAPADPDVAADI